jgi:predicted Rdx family selenoprotein
VSCPSNPAPPKVSSVPGTTGSVLVKVNAGVAVRQSRSSGGYSGRTSKSKCRYWITSARDEWRCDRENLLGGEDHIECRRDT